MSATRRRRSKSQTITLHRGKDGTWHTPGELEGAFVTDPDLEKTSPYPPRSAAEIRTLQTALGLQEPPLGVDVRPTLASKLFVYRHPAVPGSIGRWQGKGTRKDPYHWVGLGEKAVGITIGALIAIWGLEQLGVDVSNWWSGSVLNVNNDITSLDQDILSALGIPYSTDSNGKTTGTGARKAASFWTWLFQQIMVQGQDLEQAVSTVNGLSTGFPSGQGLSAPPPAASASAVGSTGSTTGSTGGTTRRSILPPIRV
jgi:hypothetical protein